MVHVKIINIGLHTEEICAVFNSNGGVVFSSNNPKFNQHIASFNIKPRNELSNFYGAVKQYQVDSMITAGNIFKSWMEKNGK